MTISGTTGYRSARALVHAVFLLFGMLLSGLAMAQSAGLASFNHAATGYILDGAHLRQQCESCHTQGMFRGTPRDCATCHRAGGRAPGKTASHLPTSAGCDSCHFTAGWTPANFRHRAEQGVMTGNCSSCHNGGAAPGKPPTHVVTQAACDSCHKTAAWIPAGYNHARTDAGSCANCHNGTRATGKSVGHIPTTASCDACHAAGIAFAPISVGVQAMHRNMAGPSAAGNCSSCHGGGFVGQNAQAKPASHIQTSDQCDTCHSSTTSWATATFDHATSNPPVTGICSSCHGVSALGKPASHIPTSQQCDTCHTNFTAFKPARMNHVGVAGQCSSCHNGSFAFANARAKSLGHIPTTAQCDTCHVNGFVTWSPAVMDHSNAAGKCSNCHSGGFLAQNAQTKPATHVATSAQCDTCHTSTTSWATKIFNHDALSPPAAGRCSSCHNSVSAIGKPSTHIPTSLQCDNCHNSFNAFKPAAMNHAGLAGQCSTCHNGSYAYANAKAKPITHIPTTAQCDSCHVGGFASWSPATMNHAGLAGLCASCHGGAYVSQNAQVKPPTHVSTSAQCDTCHTSTNSWATRSFNHAAAGVPVVNNCSACHNGTQALGKPTNHIPTTQQCDACHNNFTAFRPAVMNHGGTTGQCSTCHGGSYVFANALAKPTTHVSTTAQCDTCHQSTATWLSAAFNHAAANIPVTNNCSTCHNGVQALGKASSHIPTTQQCDTCHSNFTAFKPAAMNHSVGTAGQCSTCHSGAYLAVNAQAKSATHVVTTAQCDNCHRSTTSWATATFNHAAAGVTNPGGDCKRCHGVNALGKPSNHIPTSQQCSDCHTNFTAFKPAAMSHAGMAGQCSTCHNGAYVFANALAKPITHIPTTAQCDSCHVGGFAAWSPATMNHGGLAGLCSSCHGGAYVSQNAQAKPATHVSTAAQCDTCHASTSSWATARFDHAAAGITNPGGVCSLCHVNPAATGKPQGLAKPSNHIPTQQECSTCHTNFSSFRPAAMNHSAGASGQCSTCHGGSYVFVNAQTKSARHIPTTAQCDSCHQSTVTWASAAFNHAGAGVPVANNCSSCHNGVQALGKPASHFPTTRQCDTCHNNFAAFKPAAMNHAGTSAQCSTCHGGAYLSVNALAKPATHVATTAQCDTCHTSTTTWTGAVFTHGPTAVGNCSNCHNGTAALGKNPTHIPTTKQCDTCHAGYVAFKPAAMNHTGTANQCSSCHNGSYTAVNALGKTAGMHIPTTAQCDVCHINGFVSFMPGTMNHAAVGAAVGSHTCLTCHSGTYVSQNAQAMTATPNHASAAGVQCDNCHASTTTWATATFNHASTTTPVTGRCSTCHNGTNALGKPGNHLRTDAQCDTCHTGFVAFAPALMNHGGTTGPVAAGNCSTCHDGSLVSINAQAKPATHIPTTNYPSCDSCHGTVAWKPTTFAHNGVLAGSCATCHGASARGKPASHLPTTAPCDVCHTNYTAFAPARMNHAGTSGPLAANNCSTCHSGAYLSINAQVKPATHVATSAQCDTCHRSTASWATATYAHESTAVGRCANCHNGATALGKPTTHIPTTAQCDTCHSGYTAFRPAQMSHAGTLGPVAAGNCSTCHNGSYVAVNALAKSSTHIPTTAQCDSCHTRGYTSWIPAVMNHTGLANQCSTCHSGAYLAQNAQIKPATHILTAAQCDTCHSSTTTWATATFNHATATPTVAGRCSSCHNGVNALGKPTTHIPTSAQCDTCHKIFTAFAPATMSHAGTTGPVAAGNCATCHSGTYVSINAQAKPSTHIPTTSYPNCDSCHTTSAWKPTNFSHSGVSGTCYPQCHDGVKAAGKPALHITPPAGQDCNICHRTGISWLPVITPYLHTGVAAGSCTNCHGGAYPNIDVKPQAGHLPTTAQCDACHHNYNAWLPTSYNHVGAGSCQVCHGGAYANIVAKPSNHIPTTSPAGAVGNECNLCHGSTASFTVAVTMRHGTMQTSCIVCHDSSSPYLTGGATRINRASGDHAKKGAATKDCSSSGCHKPQGSLGTAYTRWKN